MADDDAGGHGVDEDGHGTEPGGFLMYRTIVVGFNDSDESRDALALGKLIAESTGGRLIVAGVVPYGPSERLAAGAARQAIEEAEAEFAGKIEQAARDVGAEAEAFPSSSPARGLHDAIEELGGDLVVVGSSSRALAGRILAGNVALSLLHGSPCAVAVAPKGLGDGDVALRVIAVGIDGSEESREALRVAVELGEAARATLRLVAAAHPSTGDLFGWGYGGQVMAPTYKAVLEEALDRGVEEVPDELRPDRRLVTGAAAEALTGEVEQGADLLVVGSRGYGPVRRVLLGSVSGALVRSAPCAVLVVPRGVHTGADGSPEAAAAPRGSA